ncbi:MAG: hypothetical protein AABX89_04540 [Candidatus Thermoplasmatota archaeon]
MRFALALFLVVLFLPAAQAQQQAPVLTMVAGLYSGLIVPDVGVGEVQIEWVYQFPDSAQANAAAGSTTTLHWSHSCADAGIQLTGPKEETIAFPVTLTMNAIRGETRFQVTATREVLALQVVVCDVFAYADAVNLVTPATAITAANFPVAAAYLGILEATPRDLIASGAAGEQLTFRVDVANFGNAATRVQTHLLEPLPADWVALLPADLLLRSPLEERGDSNGTLTFTVLVPRTSAADEAALRIALTPFAVQDSGASGPAVEMTLLARNVAATEAATEAAEDAVAGKLAPGAGPLLIVGLLALAFVLRSKQ